MTSINRIPLNFDAQCLSSRLTEFYNKNKGKTLGEFGLDLLDLSEDERKGIKYSNISEIDELTGYELYKANSCLTKRRARYIKDQIAEYREMLGSPDRFSVKGWKN